MEEFEFNHLAPAELERLVLKAQRKVQLRQAATLPVSSDSGSAQSSTSSHLSETSPRSHLSEQASPHTPISSPLRSVGRTEERGAFPQHQRTCENIAALQLSTADLLAAINLQLVSEPSQQEDSDVDSPKLIRNKHTWAMQFSTRFRRNHVYPLQVQVDRLSQEKYCDIFLRHYPAGNTSRQLALRSTERCFTQVFQALQVYQRQCVVLRELYAVPSLLEDLLSQLVRLCNFSTLLGLPCQRIIERSSTLKDNLARHVVQQELARLELESRDDNNSSNMSQQTKQSHQPPWVTSPKKSKSTRVNSTQASRFHSPKKSSTRGLGSSRAQPVRQVMPCQRKNLLGLARESQNREAEEPPVPEIRPAAGSVVTSQACSAQSTPRPASVRLVVMRHAEPSVRLTDIQDVATQTTGGHQDEGQQTSPTTHPSQTVLLPQWQPNRASQEFTRCLQQAVLCELAGSSCSQLDPLVEQLLREEFT